MDGQAHGWVLPNFFIYQIHAWEIASLILILALDSTLKIHLCIKTCQLRQRQLMRWQQRIESDSHQFIVYHKSATRMGRTCQFCLLLMSMLWLLLVGISFYCRFASKKFAQMLFATLALSLSLSILLWILSFRQRHWKREKAHSSCVTDDDVCLVSFIVYKFSCSDNWASVWCLNCDSLHTEHL